MRVLLVEDEGLIRMLASDMLEELGHTVIGEASNLDEALALARVADFDVAILDINLNGHCIDPVAKAVCARKIPFLFASGYGDASLPAEFSNRPMLQKPFLLKNLDDELASIQSSG
jgi:CheY-like chemotaxis protein